MTFDVTVLQLLSNERQLLASKIIYLTVKKSLVEKLKRQ